VKLRDLRKQLAQAEAAPVYTIFTNDQLAEMVRRRLTTLTDLQTIVGVGEARVAK
jgi:superfamily II DNA helicase RecQ